MLSGKEMSKQKCNIFQTLEALGTAFSAVITEDYQKVMVGTH